MKKGVLCRGDTSVEAENLIIVPFKSVTLRILLVLEFKRYSLKIYKYNVKGFSI